MKRSMKWVELTREQAADHLSKTTVKRNIRKGVAANYAQDMDSGDWRARICPPIIVTPSGAVLDGNHRLTAFLTSDLDALPTWIMETDDPDAALVLDIGPPRSLADQLEFRGHYNTRYLQALWNTEFEWKGGDTGRKRPSRTQQVAWLEANPNAQKAASVAKSADAGGGKVIRFPIGVVGALYDIACYAEGGDSVEEFVSGATHGTITFPILSRLQSKMADHSNPRNTFRMSPSQIGYSTARVYLAWLNEETGLEKLYATRRTLRDLPGWYDWLKAMWPEMVQSS